jgi:DNA helicase HerA-like ATPase
MSYSPIEEAQGRRIGTVEFISPSEIKVSLDLDAPDDTAINAGTPRPFPRINNYLLIPSEDGFVIGQVEWLAIERSPFPKRKGLQDFGLIDLPFPARKLSLNPVGTLIQGTTNSAKTGRQAVLSLKRGVYAFPSVGDPVFLPTDEQLRNIIESGQNRRVLIGRAPLAGNAEVRIDPDRLFGRHLAILGNTGSGKSCTVAGLIQWSLEEARNVAAENVNARFIILDPNGEYTKAFTEAKVFKGETPIQQLRVPLWFWNSEEWCSFVQASGKSQRPLLRRALREIRSGTDLLVEASSEEARKQNLRRYLSSQLISIRRDRRSNSIKTDSTKVGFSLKAIKEDLDNWKDEVADCSTEIQEAINEINVALAATFKSFVKDGKTIEYYQAFTEQQIATIEKALGAATKKLGGIVYQEGPGENTPLPFDGAAFADHLEVLGDQENVSQFIDTLIIRIRTMLADPQMKAIVSDAKDLTLARWLSDYIGDAATPRSATVVDLSLIPSEIIHIVTAVIARMIFEALQRYRISHPEGKPLPTVLVMEEAHTFIRRYREDLDEPSSAATCCRVFERIAREGRKFGLGLVLSSQRPSELSQTVLSQCNSFLLHRLSNDKDQEAVSKLLPDNLRGILRELPVLPTRYAFLLGWASELPILTHIRELSKSQQPESSDPDFWAVWTGKGANGEDVKREVDWSVLAQNWQTVEGPQEPGEIETISAAEQSDEISDEDIPF